MKGRARAVTVVIQQRVDPQDGQREPRTAAAEADGTGDGDGVHLSGHGMENVVLHKEDAFTRGFS